MACSTWRSAPPRRPATPEDAGLGAARERHVPRPDRADIDDPPDRLPQPIVDSSTSARRRTGAQDADRSASGEPPAPGPDRGPRRRRTRAALSARSHGARPVDRVHRRRRRIARSAVPVRQRGIHRRLSGRMARDRTVPVGAHRRRGAGQRCHGTQCSPSRCRPATSRCSASRAA